MTTLLRPNGELVASAWLGGLAGLSPQMVATQLPRDVASWQAGGFVTVAVNGGSPGIHNPMRSPTFRVDTWAVSRGSSKPQWFMANTLMELVDAGCRAQSGQRWLTLPSGYDLARVLTAYLLSEPQRVYDDAGNLARYTANLALHWTAAS